MIFRPKGRHTWRARLRLLGQVRDVSLKTDWKPQAERRHRALLALDTTDHGRDALRAWLDGTIALDPLLDAYRNGEQAIRDLLLEAREGSLPDLLAQFLRSRPPSTRAQHARQLRKWLPASLSQVTGDGITAFLDGLAGSPTTRWHYGISLKMFTRWLAEQGHSRPVRFALPKRSTPRAHWLDQAEVDRVLAASAPDARAAFALMYGAGLEVGAVRAVRVRDLDPATRSLRARGTKTWTRDRVCRVEAWAWPYVQQRAATRLPDALLYPVTYKWLRVRHQAALRACHLEGTMHDARHSWAVRMLRGGVPVEAVARQLGHKDPSMTLRVYGRFLPQTADWERWEARMAPPREETA